MNSFIFPNSKISINLFFILYLVLYIVYFFVGFYSPGFDDEYFNIGYIEKLGFGIFEFTQTTDVHPPGSYIIDLLLFKFFGAWDLVRGFIAILTVSALVYAVESVRKLKDDRAGMLLLILLALNPGLLLWCTSIRWYAFFLPVLIWLLFVPKVQDFRYWLKFFSGMLVLGYIGYMFIIIAPSIFLIYWRSSYELIKIKIKNILLFGSVFCILYSYQMVIFINVHLKNKDGQIFSTLKAISGFWIALISNQGVFPLSIGGVFSGLGTIVAFLIAVASNTIPYNFKNQYFK